MEKDDLITITLEGEQLNEAKDLVEQYVFGIGWDAAYLVFKTCVALMEAAKSPA